MKELVIYFSHTGENYMKNGIENIEKGNTEIVAENISHLTGADLFKVEPLKEYPYNYHECCDVAKEELENNSRPEIKNKLENISDYDTIYIGGPVWWSHYPMCMFTCLENLDFTGKTIYPFATNAGWLGKTFKDIEKLCPNSKIEKEMNIVFESYSDKLKTTEKELNDWINSIEK
ncbi:putative uncharacterized protein [Clostridium sp. CAG:417]|nr:putative uncharacterized protein [Clostridium sp. CAG:417]